uniref:Uncharacterized protein n=1 Tax=Oryza barthii TaxID=65489 RepID=A0A0D3GST6_9ORYZ
MAQNLRRCCAYDAAAAPAVPAIAAAGMRGEMRTREAASGWKAAMASEGEEEGGVFLGVFFVQLGEGKDMKWGVALRP